MTASLFVTLIAIGLGLSAMAAVMFQMITGRVARLSFEDGDAGAVPLAIVFRLIAGPGILVCSYFNAVSHGKGDTLGLAGAAFGVLWGAAYGVGLGVIV